jgi:hypothetical protein
MRIAKEREHNQRENQRSSEFGKNGTHGTAYRPHPVTPPAKRHESEGEE